MRGAGELGQSRQSTAGRASAACQRDPHLTFAVNCRASLLPPAGLEKATNILPLNSCVQET